MPILDFLEYCVDDNVGKARGENQGGQLELILFCEICKTVCCVHLITCKIIEFYILLIEFFRRLKSGAKP